MNEALLQAFPGVRFHEDLRLVTWHPQGVFDGALADRLVQFIEAQEQVEDTPFNRYTDLSGLTDIRLKIGHAFQIARRRRSGYVGDLPVKSAFFCDRVVGFGIARLYETLMEGAPIEVRAFRTREAAAEWLNVPLPDLQPPPQL